MINFSSIAYNVKGERNIFINHGFWEPKWVTGVGRNIKRVHISEVSTFFRKFLSYNKDMAIEFLKKNEVENLKKLNHVPYRELREALRLDNRKQMEFDRLHKIKDVVYQGIHDSDLTNLRVQTTGKPEENIGLYLFSS